jgi:hypothetical protein
VDLSYELSPGHLRDEGLRTALSYSKEAIRISTLVHGPDHQQAHLFSTLFRIRTSRETL